MAKESASAYVFAIVSIVLIVGIVFVVQNLKYSSAEADIVGQVYTATETASCDTVKCSNGETAICYADEKGDCKCPPCSE